ncbi:hypothetical protein LSH36_287g05018 [Paralvinella palmiformis]|uniref:Uncharacterized protein n=1 Tax=Paralvinella palmiformis TaxID=53620 RepID=A0AAD9JIE4_9ANNE|nr:hypothetical protein LSH36_287g05018 [Paralvinella palmiformis]
MMKPYHQARHCMMTSLKKHAGSFQSQVLARERQSSACQMYERRKLVVVGDGECGKTSLLMVFSRDHFPELYIPTIFETHISEIQVDGRLIELVLYDTAGQEDYERLRPLSYPNTDVVLICFSVDNPDSFVNVAQTWLPEVRHFCTGTPILLVATKSDLRGDNIVHRQLAERKLKPVTTEQGMAMASKIGAHAYLECSAKTRHGVQEVFQRAAKAALLHKRRKHHREHQKQCVIL